MQRLAYLLLFAIIFTCRGQENKVSVKQSKHSALLTYQQQKHRIEFKAYEMFYNEKAVKLGTIADAVKIFGKPDNDNPDLIFYDNPVNILPNDITKIDKFGNGIIVYNGNEYTVSDATGNYIKKYRDLFTEGKARYAKERDKDGILLGDVLTYRIWMSPYYQLCPNQSRFY